MTRRGVVIDTNVLIAGSLSRTGPPSVIVDAMLDGHVCLLVDQRVIDEYEDVFRRPRFAKVFGRLRYILDYIQLFGIWAAAYPLAVTLPDPDDVPFLEVAAAGRVHLLTGNEGHYTPVTGTHAVEVLSPRRFVDHILPALVGSPLNTR